MNTSEIAQAVKQICEQKGIPLESVVGTIEAALAAAYRKDFGNRLQNIKVHFNMETGDFDVFDIKTVVPDEMAEVEDEKEKEEIEKTENKKQGKKPKTEMKKGDAGDKRTEGLKAFGEANLQQDEEEKPKFNPKTMITLTEAREKFPNIDIDGEWKVQLEVPDSFGRMASQTAKQVIIQKLREAERETLFNLYKEKEGEVINGMIQRIEGRLVLIDLGNITAVLPPGEQVKNERFKVGDRVKIFIKSVNKGPKGPEIIVSRVSPEIVRRLFELEVPEIAAGTVEIKSVAREAGLRSKIAVTANEENIDPIGSCVGQRGTRVQTVINELSGEKIDIIEHSESMEKFIANALAPAKVIRVDLDDNENEATAYVNEDQLSLAIGKAGQNVRLAAQLTGLKIDIAQEGSSEIKTDSKDEKESEPVDSDSMEMGNGERKDEGESEVGDKAYQDEKRETEEEKQEEAKYEKEK